MSGSHKFEFSTSKSFEALREAVEARMNLEAAEAAAAQEAFEFELRKLTMALEREIHGVDFTRMDEDAAGIIYEGKRYKKQKDKTRTVIQTTAGPVPVLKTVYRERGGHGGKTISPLEMRLGLVKGWTPAAARLGSEFIAQVPVRDAVRMLTKTGTLCPSVADLDRITKVMGEAWEANREEFEVEVRKAEANNLPAEQEVSLILVSLDGVMVPMKDAPRIPGLGKLDQGPKGHKEAGCGTIALFGPDRSRLHTVKLARMPESKKVILQQQLKLELENLTSRYPNAPIQAVADGAHENWRILEEISNELGLKLELTLDFFHAFENICEAFRAYSGRNSEQLNHDIKRWRDALLRNPNGAKNVKLALKYRYQNIENERKKELILQKYNYVSKYMEMMNYADLKSKGRPIGSGLQEAACKTLVSQRMKSSGMSWSRTGGQAVLNLRAAVQSERLELMWNVLSPAFRREVLVDEDLGRLKPRRLAA